MTVEYVASAKHLPRTPIRVANLNRPPRLRLVPQARPSLLWEPPELALRRSPGLALRYARAVSPWVTAILALDMAYNYAFPVQPRFAPQPGGEVVPGWEFVSDYSNAFPSYAATEYAPGDVFDGKTFDHWTGTWSFSDTIPPSHSTNNGIVYVSPSLGGMPGGFVGGVGVGSTMALRRLQFRHIVLSAISEHWGVYNELWRLTAPSFVEPQVVTLPGGWVADPLPLGQPLPLPLAQPGFPVVFPSFRPSGRPRPRLRPRLQSPRAIRVTSVEIDVRPNRVVVRKGRERPPPRGTRETKAAGRNALASLVFQTWETVQDWRDWLEIVTRFSDAPTYVRRGGPTAQLEWWFYHPEAFLSVDWIGVAWGLAQWRIDESIGALMGRLSSETRGNFGQPVSMGYSGYASQRSPVGQSYGQWLTTELREALNVSWP